MLDKIEHIKVGETEYPVAFTVNVMADLQEKYGSLDGWSSALQPEQGEPKIRDVIYTYMLFINEGIDIENEQKGENRPLINEKQSGRIITEIGFNNAGTKIMKIVTDSTPGDEDPNAQTVQTM